MVVQRLCLEDLLILQLCRSDPDYDSVLQMITGEAVSWGKLVKITRLHRVSALVLDRLLRLPLPDIARAVLQGEGRRRIASVIHDNLVFKSELTRILSKLRTGEIDVILLKGLSLNSSGLREMGDIDLMVPETQVADAIDRLLEIDGYCYRRMGKDGPDATAIFRQRLSEAERRRVHAQLSWNNEFQLFNSANAVLVELHHKVFQIRERDWGFLERIDGIIRGTPLFWQDRREDPELGCSVLSPVHSALLACLRNAIKHPPAGNAFRLSNLVDIDTLAAAGIPWPLFVRDCLWLEVAPFVLFSLTLARKLLDTPIPQWVLREIKAACTQRHLRALSIHRRCVVSLGPSSVLYSRLYKALSPWVFGGSFIQRLRWLFLIPEWLPSRARMTLFFGLPKDSPWMVLAYLMNPVRWILRLLGSRIRFRWNRRRARTG
jgi:hypothetical protein